jgi:hypothetical protein
VAIAAASSHGVFATVFGRLLEANGDHNKAALLSMNPARKLLILLEPVISSLRGAQRRGNRRCLEYTFENSRLDRML